MNYLTNSIQKSTGYNHIDSNHELNIAVAKEIKNGEIEKAQELIARLTSIDDKLITYICSKGLTSLLKFVLSHFPDAVKDRFENLLINMCSEKREEIAIVLIEANVSLSGTIEAKIGIDSNRGYHETTVLHIACCDGLIGLIKSLFDRGISLNSKDIKGYTPLHFACEYNQPSVVQLLIEKGVDIHETTSDSNTGLHIACNNNLDEIAEILLQNGANIHLVNGDGKSPLVMAYEKKYEDLCELLFEYATSTPTQEGQLSETEDTQYLTCHIAAMTGDIDIIRERILNQGLNIHHMICDYSFLRRAAENGHIEIVRFLLDNGAHTSKKLDYVSAGVSNSIAIFEEFRKKGISLATEKDQDQKELWDAIFGNLLKEDDVEGLSLDNIKALFLNFWNDEKKFLVENNLSFDLYTMIYESIAEMTTSGNHTKTWQKHYARRIAEKVKEGKEPVFIRTGWIDHNIIYAFYKGFGVVVNKGSRGRIQAHNFQIFHFDPEKFTETTVTQLIEAFEQEKKLSVITLYKKILQEIDADANEAICEQIQRFIKDLQIFKDHKRDNCGTANFKPILFFVLCIDKLTQFSKLNQVNSPTLSRELQITGILFEAYEEYKAITAHLRKYVKEKLGHLVAEAPERKVE